MKLAFDKSENRWFVGNEGLNCGQQVQITFTDVNGDTFHVWGRFEITGANNPVFYTVCGRFVPDLHRASFRTRNMILGGGL